MLQRAAVDALTLELLGSLMQMDAFAGMRLAGSFEHQASNFPLICLAATQELAMSYER